MFGVHLSSHEFAVAPGQSLSLPVLLYNQSTEDQNLTLSISGVPSNWVSVPSPLVHLAPGEQREMVLTVQPPALPDGHAARHTLVIRVASQQAPAEAVEATCTLTVAALEVTLAVQPPALAQTRAGRHPFRILVNSRGAPAEQPTEPPEEQPTEEPPGDGEADRPGLPCFPAAFSLMAVPLLVKKEGRE